MFSTVQNILTKLKTLLKKSHFCGAFKKTKWNPFPTWKSTCSLLFNKLNRVHLNFPMKKNTLISNKFSNFICNVGLKLANNINHKDLVITQQNESRIPPF